MGVFAVEELLRGNSNRVICERRGSIIATDINYALILDRMYKKKLKDGDLERFSEAEVEQMKSEIAEKEASMLELFSVEHKINL